MGGDDQKAFEEIKMVLCSKLILQRVNPDKPFVLRVDASRYAVGATLEQRVCRGLTFAKLIWNTKPFLFPRMPFGHPHPMVLPPYFPFFQYVGALLIFLGAGRLFQRTYVCSWNSNL